MARLIEHIDSMIKSASKGLLLLVVIGLMSFGVSAQTYPIQVTTSILPPYNPNLSYYTSASSNSFQVVINSLEFDRIDHRVKLRLTIEGGGIKIYTNPNYNPQPLVLQGGVPEMLSGYDLRNYFNANNLIFEGISRAQFIQSGSLPEGFYTFTIEVLDYNRSVRVSNQGMANAWMMLNDPPLINMPFNGDKLQLTNPQNISFSWVGRHLASPNSAFSTEYEFTLYEMYPGQDNPEVAVRNSNSIFTTTTTQTSLNYGVIEPQLTPGRKYAYRVRAYDVNGLDLFKNRGYSETQWFQYGDACLELPSVAAEALDHSRIKLEWETQPNHNSFVVKTRQSGTDIWSEETTYATSVVIPDLSENTTYEYQVQGKCQQFFGPLSTLETVTTMESEEVSEDYTCGVESDLPELNPNPLEEPLMPRDRIRMGNLEIILETVTANGDGTYSGTGYAPAPVFNNAGIKVELRNIVVNEDYRCTDGSVKTTYDETGRFILDTTKPEEEDLEEDTDGEGETEGTQDEEEDSKDEPINVEEDIGDISVTEEGDIIITDEDGNPIDLDIKVPEGDDVITFEDENGDTWTVDSDGNVTEGSGSDDGSDSDNSEEEETEESSADEITFGPVTVALGEVGEPSVPDAEGYCSYTDIPAQIEFSLEDSNFEPIEVNIPNATISFKKHCENGEYKDIEISYSNEDGIGIGTVAFVEATLKSINLSIDENDNLSGSVSMSASLTEDQEITEIFKVKSGISGDFSYSFNNTNSFGGSFDLSRVSGIAVDLLKGNKVIASMTKGSFNGSALSGTFRLASGVVDFQNDYFKANFKQLEIDAQYSPNTGFEFISGDSRIEFSQLKGMTGKVMLETTYTNDQLTSSLTSNTLSGFGMVISDANLTAELDKSFDLVELSGQFSAKHTEFSAALSVTEFSYNELGLQVFNANGSVDYSGIHFEIQECHYAVLDDVSLLQLDAVAEIEAESGSAMVSVQNFTIDENGEISYDELAGSVEGSVVLGPITVTAEGGFEDNNGGKLDGKKTREISGSAEVILKTIDKKGNELLKTIAGVDVVYRRYKNPEDGGIINASLDFEGAYEFGTVNGIDLTLKDFALSIDDEGNLSGGLGLDAKLEEDKEIRDIFYLKKGLSGSVSYTFNGDDSFAGFFDFSDVTNINISAMKGDQEIASLRNGTFNGSVISGTITAGTNASYQSNSFELTLNDLTLNAAYDFEQNSLTVNSGKGKVTASSINGLDGSLVIDLDYGVDNNFNASLNNTTDISGLGFTFSDFSLTADFNQSFDLIGVSGGLKASHDEIDTEINISTFEIEHGSLKTLSASGKIVYKGFDFNLLSCEYAENILNLDAKLAINATGTEAQFAVYDFQIDSEGDISLRQVTGNLNKGNHLNIGFDIAMEETRFTGSFEGELKSIGVGVSGTLDIGKEEDYNFAYLALTGNTDITLGATGLKLTKLGGQIGYNYMLTYSNGAFTGNPKEGNYQLGLTLGVADVANMCEITGNPVVQFSSSTLNIDLSGQLNVTRNNPMITSDLTAQYSLPANTMSGSISTDFEVPENSGKFFKSSSQVGFSFANNNWNVEGNNISASLLSMMSFQGSFNYSGQIEPFTVSSIELDGRASMNYNLNYNASISSVASLDVVVNASINSYVTARLNRQGLLAEMGVDVAGNIDVSVDLFGFDVADIHASVEADGVVGIRNTKGYIKGTAEYSVDIANFDYDSIPIDFDYEYDLRDM